MSATWRVYLSPDEQARAAQAATDVDIAALLTDDVPCGGIGVSWLRRECDRSAVLRSHGHGCRDDAPRRFKCVQCWQDWYFGHSQLLGEVGYIQCRYCHRRFRSVAEFSDYRPF